ncbi:MAG TPA: class II aldolase/adducin family protein, partial [Chloroflexota bacterium]|nr:class II aldolase/adducin family protein [Chloroflexota bacterium]
MASEMDQVKYDVAVANRVLSEVGLATGPTVSLGHVSQRLPGDPNKFVVKGRGYEIDSLPRMRPEDMVVCDLEGYMLDGPKGATPCYEVQIHAAVLKQRPDVNSVVHVHPPFTVLFSILGKTIAPMAQGQAINILKKQIPTMRKYKIIQSQEEGIELANILGDNMAMLLLGHGVVVAGSAPDEVVIGALGLEEQAKMNYYAYSVAGPDYQKIPDDLVQENFYGGIPFEDLPHFKGLQADS